MIFFFRNAAEAYDIRGGNKKIVKAGVIENEDAMSIRGSIRSTRSIKSRAGSVKSIKSVRSDRVSILEGSIFKTRDVEVEDDNISVKTLTEEGQEEVYNDRASKDKESVMEDEEESEVTYKSNGYGSNDGDNVSVLSFNVEGDYIASLHQRVGEEHKWDRVEAKRAGRKVEEKVVEAAPVAEARISYEEERALTDFEDVVRQNQAKYRGEKQKSNQEVKKRRNQALMILVCLGAGRYCQGGGRRPAKHRPAASMGQG